MQGLHAGQSTTGKLHRKYTNKVLMIVFRELTKIPKELDLLLEVRCERNGILYEGVLSGVKQFLCIV